MFVKICSFEVGGFVEIINVGFLCLSSFEECFLLCLL